VSFWTPCLKEIGELQDQGSANTLPAIRRLDPHILDASEACHVTAALDPPNRRCYNLPDPKVMHLREEDPDIRVGDAFGVEFGQGRLPGVGHSPQRGALPFQDRLQAAPHLGQDGAIGAASPSNSIRAWIGLHRPR
jgi:hypothetical protein